MKRRIPKLLGVLAVAGAIALPLAPPSRAACCYFAAKDKDVNQPAQKAFISWDPAEKVESFTVQPKFEGNAEDFGMVIPTPSRPKLDEMPRDFFKELAVYSILKKREYPQSKLMPAPSGGLFGGGGVTVLTASAPMADRAKSSVRVLESGIVGSLDYKIIAADRADDLFQWLKDNKYNYGGDAETLNFYVKKGWLFTVMKIDTKQMKKAQDGSYAGEVTPTRFQFTSEQLVYPLRMTRISVKNTTEALFYIQAPFKVDLPGDMTYQYQWVPSLQASMGCTPEGLPGKGNEWLVAIKDQIPALLERGQKLGFGFVGGQRPQPGKDGRIATTLEWARQLSDSDLKVLSGDAPYTETLPDVDKGFTQADLKDEKSAAAAYKVISGRLEADRKARPGGYLIREAPAEDLAKLKLLQGHLKPGQFVTKLRKTFTKGEMSDDLLIVQAKLGAAEDKSEYEEILPTSPP